jgi:hypothetical protein
LPPPPGLFVGVLPRGVSSLAQYYKFVSHSALLIGQSKQNAAGGRASIQRERERERGETEERGEREKRERERERERERRKREKEERERERESKRNAEE